MMNAFSCYLVVMNSSSISLCTQFIDVIYNNTNDQTKVFMMCSFIFVIKVNLFFLKR